MTNDWTAECISATLEPFFARSSRCHIINGHNYVQIEALDLDKTLTRRTPPQQADISSIDNCTSDESKTMSVLDVVCAHAVGYNFFDNVNFTLLPPVVELNIDHYQ